MSCAYQLRIYIHLKDSTFLYNDLYDTYIYFYLKKNFIAQNLYINSNLSIGCPELKYPTYVENSPNRWPVQDSIPFLHKGLKLLGRSEAVVHKKET